MSNYEARFKEAVHYCWTARSNAGDRQAATAEVRDVGLRTGVTSGKHLDPLSELVAKVFEDSGIPSDSIHHKSRVELPGFYRPEKKWDIVVVHKGELVAAVELKSILGSFGNNLNNRTEEALGNAKDLLDAYEEGIFGTHAQAPWLGYLFVMQREPASLKPIGTREPHFSTDPKFVGASYIRRAELLCTRLIQKRIYSGACIVTSDGEGVAGVSEPNAELTFSKFAAGISGRVAVALA